MASCSAFASLIIMLVASSALIFAVRYCGAVSEPSQSSRLRVTYGVDLNVVVNILRLDSQKQRSEPLEGAKISANPEKVDLPQSSASLRVVHAVPDTLKNGGERSDTNTGTTEYGNLKLEHILGSGTKGTVNIDSGENLAQGNLLARFALFVLFGLLLRAATEGFAKSSGKVTDHTDMDRDVVFLGRAGKGEGMVLPDGDFRAAEENVLSLLASIHDLGSNLTYLSSTGRGVLLLDLNLADIARVLNDLGDVRLVLSPNFTGDTLSQVGKSTVHPVLPKDTDTIAEGRKVWLNHAEGSVNGPEDEEDDEEMVHVPETFKVCTTSLFRSSQCDCHKRNQHDITTPTRSSSKVGEDEAHESKLVACRESGQIVPMCNRVHPGEEYNGPSDELMEGDILVERNNVVQGRTTSHRN